MVDRLTEERLAELEALTSTRLWRMSLKVEEAASLIAEVRASRTEKAQLIKWLNTDNGRGEL